MGDTEMALLVPALVLSAALALSAALVAILVRPLAGPLLSFCEEQRLARHRARAARADALLRAHRADAALRELEGAFCLFEVRSGPALVESISRHHAGVLSRLLAVADEGPEPRVRLLNLAKLDRLLDRRIDLLRASLALRSRPRGDTRRRQLKGELRRNRRDVRGAVRELVSDLQVLRSRRAAVQ